MPPPRNDIQAAAACPVCTTAFTPVRRQRYCSPACRQAACRQAAWRARHPDPTPAPPTITAPATNRRERTVYQCPDCDTRYLGQQWCHDCAKPCTRVGIGALCPHCDEPITISDITSQPAT